MIDGYGKFTSTFIWDTYTPSRRFVSILLFITESKRIISSSLKTLELNGVSFSTNIKHPLKSIYYSTL